MAQTAFEYGTSRLRLMEFDGSGRKIRVLAVGEADLEVPESGASEEDADAADDVRAERIEEAIEEGGFETDPTAMSFPASRTVFREFDLPFTNDDQVRKVVRFEAESHIPLDIDEVVIQHHVLRKSRDKSHLIVAAVKKDDLLDSLDIVGEAGLDPMLVDVDDFALFHALVGSGVAEQHERFVVVNAEERTTSLLWIVDGALYSVRSIRLGTHGVSHAQDETLTEAEQGVETARLHDYLARLTREIRRTLTMLPDPGELDIVYTLGSGSGLDGFAERMGEIFHTEASPLNLLEHVEHKLTEDEVASFGPYAGVCLGMAYKLNGFDLTYTDFRREECAYTKKFDQVKTPLIMLALLAFLAVAFTALDKYNLVSKYEREYRQIIATGSDNLAQVLDGDVARAEALWKAHEFGPPQVQAIRDALKREKENLAQQLGRSEEIPDTPSVVPVWIEFNALLLENETAIGRFALESVDINFTESIPTLKINGVVESGEKFQVLLDLLRAHPMSTTVQSGSNKITSEGSTYFTDLRVEIDVERAAAAVRGKGGSS